MQHITQLKVSKYQTDTRVLVVYRFEMLWCNLKQVLPASNIAQLKKICMEE